MAEAPCQFVLFTPLGARLLPSSAEDPACRIRSEGRARRVRLSEGPACRVRLPTLDNPSRFVGHDERAPPNELRQTCPSISPQSSAGSPVLAGDCRINFARNLTHRQQRRFLTS